MALEKFRWSKVYESQEEELVDLLEARSIPAERIHLESDVTESAQSNITLWCAEGSLFIKTDSKSMSMQPGDAVRISSGAQYSLHPGMTDCVYYQS